MPRRSSRAVVAEPPAADLPVSAGLDARRGSGRDADPGVLSEGAPELGELSRRVERDDLADADRDQSAEGSLAEPADAVLAADAGPIRWIWTRPANGCPAGSARAEQQLLARERVAQVWKAVEGLSERQRTVFLLRYVEELELSEIARATGLSEGTVKAHLSRALAQGARGVGGKTMTVQERIQERRNSRRWEALDPVLQQALRDFRVSVHAWSEAAYEPAAHGARCGRAQSWRLAAGWALGCVLVAGGVSGGVYEHHHRQELARIAAAARGRAAAPAAARAGPRRKRICWPRWTAMFRRRFQAPWSRWLIDGGG